MNAHERRIQDRQRNGTFKDQLSSVQSVCPIGHKFTKEDGKQVTILGHVKKAGQWLLVVKRGDNRKVELPLKGISFVLG